MNPWTRAFAVGAALLFLSPPLYGQNRYYLPQIANGSYDGGSFRTTFVLVNNSDAPASATIRLTDDNAMPFVATIPSLGTNSQFTVDLPAGSSRILQTDGSGNLSVGAAVVESAASIGVSSVFTIYDTRGVYQTEAGVGNSEPLSDFVLPVDGTGLFSTGIALFNPNSATANLTFALINTSGQQVQTSTGTLAAGAHRATFVTGAGALFATASNFRGTLRIQSSVPLAALVLRQNSSPLSYTSLPVVPRSTNRTSLYLAHVATGTFPGGSFKTSFLIFNPATAAANGSIALTRDDGSPLVMTLVGRAPASTVSFSLAPGASTFLETDGLGSLTVGAATITSNVPVGASAVFTVFGSGGAFQTEAGVGDSAVLSRFTLPVDIRGGGDTGVAFFNPGTTATTLTLRLIDGEGIIAGSDVTINAGPKNHVARFVSQLFPGQTEFQGVLAVSATTGVAALTLRQNAGPSYTTLPVASGAATGRRGTSPAAPSGLSVRLTSINTARLTWTDASSNETGFSIERATSATGVFSVIDTLDANIAAYDNGGLDPSGSYFYRVRAFNAYGDSPASNVASVTTTASAGLGLAINVSLSAGAFWEYNWISESRSFAQGSGTTIDSKVGKFRVTLAAPVSTGGQTAFPVSVSGNTSDGSIDFGPRWKYLAGTPDGSILGSIDGVAFTVIFNTQTKTWNGGGFFTTVPANQSVAATTTVFTGEYHQVNSISIGRQSRSGGCTYFPDIGDVCTGDPTTVSEHEYYKPGLGPIAYNYTTTQTFSGGGFTTSHTINRLVELVNTSFSAADGSNYQSPQWQEIKGMNAPRKFAAAVALNGKIYVLGGTSTSNTVLSSVEIYDPATDTWTPGVPMPVGLSGHSAEAIGGRIYVIPPNNTPVRIFNPATGVWTSGAAPGVAFDARPACSMLDDYIAVPIWGSSNAVVGFYQVSTNEWFSGQPTTTYRRQRASAACIEGFVLMAGGFMNPGSDNSLMLYYAPEPPGWLLANSKMARARYDASAATLKTDFVIAGGQNGDQVFRSVEAFSLNTGEWRSLPSMFRARKEFDTVILNGTIYAIGGSSGNTTLSQVERYRP